MNNISYFYKSCSSPVKIYLYCGQFIKNNEWPTESTRRMSVQWYKDFYVTPWGHVTFVVPPFYMSRAMSETCSAVGCTNREVTHQMCHFIISDWLIAEQLCGLENISHYSQSKIHPITAQDLMRMCRLILKTHVLLLWSLSCLVGILANTPGGVKRSGLGAHAVGLLVVY